MEPVVLSQPCHLNRMWSDIVPPETTVWIKLRLQVPEDFSCAASHVGYHFGMEIFPVKQAMYIVSLPGRVLYVPRWIFLEVLTVYMGVGAWIRDAREQLFLRC